MNRLYIVTTNKKVYSDLVIKYGLTETGNSKMISSYDEFKDIDLPVMILFSNDLPVDVAKITAHSKDINADIFMNVDLCDRSLKFIVDNLQMLDELYNSFHTEVKSRVSGFISDLNSMGYNPKRGYLYDIRLANFGNKNSLEYVIIPNSPKAELLNKMVCGYIRSVVIPSRRLKKPVLKGNSLVWE